MIIRLFTIFVLAFTIVALSVSEPLAVESKTQQDLENALSRLIPRDQFLVQVTADVEIISEKKLVEGETVVNAIAKNPEEEPPPTMPGFVPEPTTRTPQLPQQSRQSYKNIDIPVLKSVNAHVNFDDELPLATATRGRQLVEQYMAKLYPGKSTTTFAQMHMLKQEKKRDIASENEDLLKKLNEWEKNKEKKPPTLEEQAWRYGRWTALFLLTLVVLTQFLKPNLAKLQHIYSNKKVPKDPSRSSLRQSSTPPLEDTDKFLQELSSKEPVLAQGKRKLLIDRFLIRSEVFRLYYESLDSGARDELYAALRGPGYERLLDGSGFSLPTSKTVEPPDIEDFLESHSKNFEELVRAVDWQSKQSFGFLQKLTQSQLFTLASNLPARSLALVLRFMKSGQSAHILDSLPGAKRLEVLATVPEVMHASLSEIHAIERETRLLVEKMPGQFYGSKKEDIDFWGKVIASSTNQDELLNDLEKTNPGIYPNLKKFRFSLEDAATLPNNMLEKILSETENEELGLALASCREDVIEVLLDAVPERRRKILVSQIPTYRNAPKEILSEARSTLTKKMREVLT